MKLSEFAPAEVLSLNELLDSLIGYVSKDNPSPVLFDLGSGPNPHPGLKGVDLYTDTDVKHDLFNGDWSFTPDNSVDLFYSSHFIEHVPDWNAFWEKVWAKLKPAGYALVIAPFGASVRAHQDPDHKQVIFRERYWYLSAEMRKRMAVEQYSTKADFDIVEMWPVFHPKFAGLSEEQKEYHLNFTWNAVMDLTVLLRARKES